jgi:hypothetical protein
LGLAVGFDESGMNTKGTYGKAFFLRD